MIRPVKMQKLRIIASKGIIDPLIKKLHELGILEVSVSESDGLEKGLPLDVYNEISQHLVRVRGVRNSLEKYYPGESAIPSQGDLKNPVEEAKKVTLDSELKNLETEKEQIQNDLKRIKEELQITEKLMVFSGTDFSKLTTKFTIGFLGELSRDKLPTLRLRLSQSGLKYRLDTAFSQEKAFILLLYEVANESQISDILDEFNVAKIELPSNMTFPEKYSLWLAKESEKKQKRLEDISSEMSQLSSKNLPHILSLERALSIEADRARVSSSFVSSKKFYFISGWIKDSDYKKLEQELHQFGDRVAVQKAETGHHEEAPIILENPKATSQFQFLTQTYSLPSSSELDPTFIYFITVPLLYGMIVGDVIYGVISLFLAFFLNKKFSKSYIMSNITRIWMFSALPAILFGVIFDEWAGLTHLHILEAISEWGLLDLHKLGLEEPLYTGFSRAHNLPLLLGVTILLGMVHVGLGFLLGAITEWNHSKKHAFAKLSWIGVEVGGLLLVGGFMLSIFPPEIANYGLAIFSISVLGLILTEGAVGILEIPSLAGNIISYSRIAVVGVVGVIIAEIINQFFIPSPSQGIFAIFYFIIFALLHIINAFIAMFEALIQGGRLNILEFKSKFVKGGGKLFAPFAMNSYKK